MKNLDKVYAEKIAEQYAPKTESKVVALKKLDRKVKRPAEIFAYTFGTIAALILGVGMCLAMGVIGSGDLLMIIIGSVIGIVGILGASFNYQFYKKILDSRKQQYASDIISLANSITE